MGLTFSTTRDSTDGGAPIRSSTLVRSVRKLSNHPSVSYRIRSGARMFSCSVTVEHHPRIVGRREITHVVGERHHGDPVTGTGRIAEGAADVVPRPVVLPVSAAIAHGREPIGRCRVPGRVLQAEQHTLDGRAPVLGWGDTEHVGTTPRPEKSSAALLPTRRNACCGCWIEIVDLPTRCPGRVRCPVTRGDSGQTRIRHGTITL